MIKAREVSPKIRPLNQKACNWVWSPWAPY